MNDDEPQTVKRMLLYLYKLDYPDEDFTNEASSNTEEETDLGTTAKLLEDTTLDTPKLMNNVLVYAIAEKYDIPELKELAKRKFETLVNSKWPHEDFHAVTETIFSTTPEEDMGLRQIVMDICRENFQDMLEDEESKATFLNNKLIAATVLDAALQNNQQDKVMMYEALAREGALKEEITKLKADLREALGEKDDLVSRLDSAIRNANDFKKCGGCHKAFHWSLERSRGCDRLDLQLRCTSCWTNETL